MPGKFNPQDYDLVETRLKKFWEAHPTGAIITQAVAFTPDHKSVIVRAEAWFDKADAMPTCVGIAQEYAGGGGANATSHAENAETSAIGRALANCGYSGNLRASREEMQKANRQPVPIQSQQPGRFTDHRPGYVAPAPPADGEIIPCIDCGAPVMIKRDQNGKLVRYNANGDGHYLKCGKHPTGYETPADDGVEADPFAAAGN